MVKRTSVFNHLLAPAVILLFIHGVGIFPEANTAARAADSGVPDGGEVDEWEPDDFWFQANEIFDGVPQTHSIYPTGDEDWVKFTLAADSRVVLETSGPLPEDTIIRLYDSGLQELEENDDGGAGFYSLIDRLCIIEMVGEDEFNNWLSPGTYYLQIEEFTDLDDIVSYDIAFDTSPCVDAWETDDAWARSPRPAMHACATSSFRPPGVIEDVPPSELPFGGASSARIPTSSGTPGNVSTASTPSSTDSPPRSPGRSPLPPSPVRWSASSGPSCVTSMSPGSRR